MLGKNQKMKKMTLVLAILMITISVGSHFTFALSYQEQGLDKGEDGQLKAFAIKWADAFSQRDAKTIAKLCINDKLYYTIGGVADNGEYFCNFRAICICGKRTDPMQENRGKL